MMHQLNLNKNKDDLNILHDYFLCLYYQLYVYCSFNLETIYMPSDNGIKINYSICIYRIKYYSPKEKMKCFIYCDIGRTGGWPVKQNKSEN